jgi:hypothetical protein
MIYTIKTELNGREFNHGFIESKKDNESESTIKISIDFVAITEDVDEIIANIQAVINQYSI